MAAKVLFLDTVHPILQENLTRDGYECELNYTCSAEELIEIISEYTGVVIRSRLLLNEDILQNAIKLKFIARSGSGLENVDVLFAEKKGIKCFNSPEGNRDAVGEHALGMLLSLINNIGSGDQEVRSLKWNREKNRGIELGGKTVGIIGYGNTGTAFAKKLSGFSCNVITYDRYSKNIGDEFAIQVDLQDVFDQSDIVSVHIPYNEANHHFINKGFFKSFKKQIFFINTSRGKVLKTDALVDALKNEKVLGACLDVLEYENHSFENIESRNVPEALSYLIESGEVILSPHVAGWTVESYRKLSTVLYEKIDQTIPKPD